MKNQDTNATTTIRYPLNNNRYLRRCLMCLAFMHALRFNKSIYPPPFTSQKLSNFHKILTISVNISYLRPYAISSDGTQCGLFLLLYFPHNYRSISVLIIPAGRTSPMSSNRCSSLTKDASPPQKRVHRPDLRTTPFAGHLKVRLPNSPRYAAVCSASITTKNSRSKRRKKGLWRFFCLSHAGNL